MRGRAPPPGKVSIGHSASKQQQLQSNLRAAAAEREEQERALQAEQEARAEAARGEDAEQQRQMRARDAGQMIAAGHCDDARTFALQEGDLGLAAQIADLCAGTQKAVKP
jgi:hypothetical protein